VLGLAGFVYLRRESRLRIWLIAAVLAFGGLTAISMLLYNYAFTGGWLRSPYGLYRGLQAPTELNFSLSTVLGNLGWTTRFGVQSTVLFTFPFLFPLAAYGLWFQRRSPKAVVLALLFPALMAGYLIQPEHSSSYIGERYWFQGFLGVIVLAAQGTVRLLDLWRPVRAAQIAVLSVLIAGQLVMTAKAWEVMRNRSKPFAIMREAAERYRGSGRAVFLSMDAPATPAHINLNRPDWKYLQVFYLVDPGPAERCIWSARLGLHSWAALHYDAHTETVSKITSEEWPGRSCQLSP
jgi:hypothetical protein